jgi:hypothetical protein
MSNFLDQLAGKFGMSTDDLRDKAGDILDKHRDKIPDNIEDGIDDALHGDMLDELKNKFAPEGSMIDNILDKFGIGGDDNAEEESK